LGRSSKGRFLIQLLPEAPGLGRNWGMYMTCGSETIKKSFSKRVFGKKGGHKERRSGRRVPVETSPCIIPGCGNGDFR